MPFPIRLLAEGEEVIAEQHPHWSSLGWPLVSVLVAVGVTVGVVIVFPHAPVEVLYVFLSVAGVAVLWLAARQLRRMATSLVVTSARVVRRTGVLSRTDLEIRVERINELSCHQSIGGRLLREGQVLIEVSGEKGVVVLDHVPRPAELQSVISAQVSNWHREARTPLFHTHLPAVDTPPTGVPLGGPGVNEAPSAAERLVQLDELRRRGIISAAEYETKKQELLRDL
ncbi:MAG: PH domain-containing protein [Acidimicrobiales bacterium]|jgi:hypothetical protein